MIKQLSPNTYQLCCDYCGQPVMAPVQAEKHPIIRGGAECPECLEMVDEAVGCAYIEAMQEAGKTRRRQLAGQEDL